MIAGVLSAFSCNDSRKPVSWYVLFEGPFFPPWEATDVTVAPCLAKLRRCQFGRNKSINAFLSEAIPKLIGVEVEKSLVTFSVNLAKSFSMACLFFLFQRSTFLTGFLRAGRTQESTRTTSWSLMSGRETHCSISDGLLVPKMPGFEINSSK